MQYSVTSVHKYKYNWTHTNRGKQYGRLYWRVSCPRVERIYIYLITNGSAERSPEHTYKLQWHFAALKISEKMTRRQALCCWFWKQNELQLKGDFALGWGWQGGWLINEVGKCFHLHVVSYNKGGIKKSEHLDKIPDAQPVSRCH